MAILRLNSSLFFLLRIFIRKSGWIVKIKFLSGKIYLLIMYSYFWQYSKNHLHLLCTTVIFRDVILELKWLLANYSLRVIPHTNVHRTSHSVYITVSLYPAVGYLSVYFVHLSTKATASNQQSTISNSKQPRCQ